MIKRLLIANRGEIAVRVIRACREAGITSVAVYSEADSQARHVALADEAVPIGPAEPALSYLDISKVIGAAMQSNCDALHPGYGFLSERPELADACEAAGVVFVGPPASAMRMLGAKIGAKQLAVEQGVPITPGFFEQGATADQLEAAAKKIGFPVMLKASAGGGGRGMRPVLDPSDFAEQCRLASEEAVKAFGDGAMMVEKLVERPRHIEIQVLADTQGQVACLFERECSIQRRHQKLIEESPSPFMTEALWQSMSASARRLVSAAGYVGAGTVEFMVDPTTGEFHFLEVNTRLQVEHPVTEAVTGVDLVHEQLRIASGEPLGLKPALMEGDRSAICGHAIEARIVAEDPARGFLPSVGRVVGWAEPRGLGLRYDTGFAKGSEVSRYYDSLVAKLIAHGSDRAQAVSRLKGGLLDTHILGVRTNIGFLIDVIGHPGFSAAQVDTGFLGREFAEWQPSDVDPGILAALLKSGGSAPESSRVGKPAMTAWSSSDGFRNVR